MVREAGELSPELEPYSSSLNSKLNGVWNLFQSTLRGRYWKASKIVAASAAILLKYAVTKFIGVPLVCSWEGCSESEGLDLGLANMRLDAEGEEMKKVIRRLSRCGRCGMAYYCR